MATTYEMPTYADPAQVNVEGHEVCRIVTFSPATWALNDVFKIAKLPLNAKLVQGWYMEIPDIDSSTGATVSLIVVDGGTSKTIASGVSAQSAGTWFDQTATTGQQTGWVNYKITTTTAYLEAKAAAAATGTFTTGTFKVQFRYTTNLEFSD